MAETQPNAVTRCGSPFNQLLGEFLGKPYAAGATGPEAYDCYSLCRAFAARLGMELPDLGTLDPLAAAQSYAQARPAFVKLDWPRPWSIVCFGGGYLASHCGTVLPQDGKFLHCERKIGVVCEPLDHRYWHPRIEGYYWPADTVEVVLLHNPLSTSRSWHFAKTGQSLTQILPPLLGYLGDTGVAVFLNGTEIPPDEWEHTYPTALQQVVIRPQLEGGMRPLDILKMVAIVAFAFVAGPAVAGAMGFAAGSLGYALAMAGTAMVGGMVMGAILPDKRSEDQQEATSYGWNPRTTQIEGKPIPWIYGRMPVYGNIIMNYTAPVNTAYTITGTVIPKLLAAMGLGNWYYDDSQHQIFVKIAYGDGPIQGIVPGTVRINDQDAETLEGVTVEHFRGTDAQAASALDDRIEYRPGQPKIDYNTSQTWTIPDKDIDRIGVLLCSPEGIATFDKKDGDKSVTKLGVKVELRAVGGAWHTLVDEKIPGRTTQVFRQLYLSNETYEGGAPFTVTRGTQYEVRVTRTTPKREDRDRGELFLEAVQCLYADAFTYPGLAYTAIAALGSEQMSGSLQFAAVVEGRIVNVYDPGTGTWTLQYSNNPAWVIWDLLTRPMILGDGAGVPYHIEYYAGQHPSRLDLPAFAALAQWCDELVDDGRGGTEKRFTFNGSLETEMRAWEAALRVAAVCRAWLYFDGRVISVAIDRAATPTQVFTVGNVLRGQFSESWLDDSERASEIEMEILDGNQDYQRLPYVVTDSERRERIPVRIDGWGITSQSQAWRTAIHHLTVNRLMDRVVEWEAALDAIYCKVGDVVYLQHDSMNVNAGGRVAQVGADYLVADCDIAYDPGKTHALMVRHHDGTDEKLSLYVVAGVNGRAIQVASPWTYVPAADDVWMFGEATKINDLYRIRAMQRMANGQVRLTGTVYDEDYYGPEALTPVIAQQQALSPIYAQRRAIFHQQVTWEGIYRQYPQQTLNAQITDYAAVAHLAFSGNGVDRVTWSGTGEDGKGYITYLGYVYPIEPSAVGTTAKYVYFDPGADDPTVLYGTNDRAALEGQDRFVLCYNANGVAHPQPGLRLGKNASLIGVEEGADVTAHSPVSMAEFRETFEDPQNNFASRWVSYGGSGEMSLVTGGLAGGKFLRVGNNSGNDTRQLIYFKSLPFDPSKLYRMRVRVRRTAGAGTIFAGITGRNATDTAWVNAGGTNSASGQHYLCASNANPGSEWTTYTGYFRGHAAPGTSGVRDTPANPAALHTDVRYFRPYLICNYNSVAGITEWDEVSIDVVPENADQIAESSTKKWAAESGATVGATWGVNIAQQPGSLRQIFYQASAPTAGMVTGDYWINSGDNKIHRYSGSAWVAVQDSQITTALLNAATAQATADGKIKTFAQATAPTASGVGDIWLATNDNHKPYRWSGSAWVAVDYDVATWSKIVGPGKPEDGADVTGNHSADVNIDRMPMGAFFAKQMEETFENYFNDLEIRWMPVTPAIVEQIWIVSGGAFGGKFLRIGDNSGNDAGHFIFDRSIPFDPNALYRMRISVRRTAGTGTFSAGVCGRNAADNGWVDYQGSNNYFSPNAFKCVASGKAGTASWVTYEGYFRGTAATGDTGEKPNPTDPAKLHTNVRYVRPFFYVNQTGNAGTYEVDNVILEKVEVPDNSTLELIAGVLRLKDGGTTFAKLAAGGVCAKIGTYTGTGVSGRTFTGVGFQPNLLILIDMTHNSALGIGWKLSGMGTSMVYTGNLGYGLSTTMVVSLDADGFTLGTNHPFVNNADGRTYWWVAFGIKA